MNKNNGSKYVKAKKKKKKKYSQHYFLFIYVTLVELIWEGLVNLNMCNLANVAAFVLP